MGTGRRGLIAAAVTAVCAVIVPAAPGTAFADPGPTPPPAAAPPPAATASDEELEAVRDELDKLYRAAAVATDEYNAAEEEARRHSAELAELARKITEGREELDRLGNRAGAAARAQYRTGGLPDEAKLVLSDDPRQFLDGTGRVLQGQRATKGLIAERNRAQQDLRTYAADASARRKGLEADREAKQAARKEVERRIAAAEELESRLEREERERLERLEREAARRAQAAWLGSGVLEGASGEASERGGKAVRFAMDQVGKPYRWGAEGPAAYDCSGLTSRAWASAGLAIPRTSQQQWEQLRHVDVGEMRPGDLIIYFPDASHVGMYVGDGMVVHAPRPGRTITVAGAGSMPVLGVVRPDAT
ncbi:hypothetical protein SUDANB58_02673 [Streptomyces sp. enrichment culture]|uniref:C40 family peptidase n=1 Tax=Streptomyces sp. enrichment culture TaxID=1795815 RepID=UPI003F564119